MTDSCSGPYFISVHCAIVWKPFIANLNSALLRQLRAIILAWTHVICEIVWDLRSRENSATISHWLICMMTSSNENIFHFTGHLCGEFSGPRRPVTRSFDVFFDLRLNKRLSKQSWGWWFETPSSSLWRHCSVGCLNSLLIHYQPWLRTILYLDVNWNVLQSWYKFTFSVECQTLSYVGREKLSGLIWIYGFSFFN